MPGNGTSAFPIMRFGTGPADQELIRYAGRQAHPHRFQPGSSRSTRSAGRWVGRRLAVRAAAGSGPPRRGRPSPGVPRQCLQHGEMAGQGVLPERGQPDRPVLAGHVVVRGLLPGRVTGPHARSRRPPACVRTPGIRGPARTSTWRSTVDGLARPPAGLRERCCGGRGRDRHRGMRWPGAGQLRRVPRHRGPDLRHPGDLRPAAGLSRSSQLLLHIVQVATQVGERHEIALRATGHDRRADGHVHAGDAGRSPRWPPTVYLGVSVRGGSIGHVQCASAARTRQPAGWPPSRPCRCCWPWRSCSAPACGRSRNCYRPHARSTQTVRLPAQPLTDIPERIADDGRKPGCLATPSWPLHGRHFHVPTPQVDGVTKIRE